MKLAQSMAAQGDVLFRRIDALPGNARKVPRDGPLVVAHSETGHHHVIRSPHAELYSTGDELVSFLRVDDAFVDVEHLRPFDTHETVRLLGSDNEPTFFEVRRQREHAIEHWRIVND
jgi:hypothetical protein